MRCRLQGAALRAEGRASVQYLCPGCRKVVKQQDYDATQCDLRNGWWHKECVDVLVGAPGYERAVPMPDPSDEQMSWVCPQCTHFLCWNAKNESHLCVSCWKGSERFGPEEGTDMIACEGPGGGLFHKSCVGYRSLEEDPPEDWMCPACEGVADDMEWVELEMVPEGQVGGNNVVAIRTAIEKAVEVMKKKPEVFVRGFQTRLAVLQKIVDCKGGNNYNLHWRREEKVAGGAPV